MGCSVRWSEEFFTCPNISFLHIVFVLLQVPCLLASTLHVCFNKKNSAQFSSCPYDKAFGERPLKVWPFLLALLKKRCATRDSRNSSITLFPIFRKIDLTGIADTPCRKSPFAMHFTEVTSSTAQAISNVLATATELFRFLGSPPAFSVCLSGLFKLSFSSREILLTNFLFEILDRHHFLPHVVSSFLLVKSILTAQRRNAFAVLIVAADDKTHVPKFRRLAASSSR